MTWTPSIALAGAILALGPLIIYWIFRRRHRLVPFAAIRFLLEGQRKHRHRTRLEEMILLALRILACLLIGLTLANIRSAKLVGGQSAAVAHVVILDDSLSMGQRAGTVTLFQKALTHLAGFLQRLPDADQVAIISASRPLSGDPLGRLAPVMDLKRDNFVERLTALKPSDLKADFVTALREAGKLADAQSDAQVRLYVVSDMRHQDLAGPGQQEALRKAFAAFDPARIDLDLLDFGLPCPQNLSVERISLGRGTVVAGVPTPLRVSIRNTGTETAAPCKLKVNILETALPDLAVPELAAGERADVSFFYTFDKAGSSAVTVSLPTDSLPADDEATLALDVRGELRILVVDGSADPAAPSSASYALVHALDPSGQGAYGRRVDVQSAAGWNPAGLEAYDLVIIADLRDFAAVPGEDGKTVYPAVVALEEYVRNGGGLCLIAGEQLSVPFFNGPLYAEGQGLMPLQLRDSGLATVDRKAPLRLDVGTVAADGMLRVFGGTGALFAKLVGFYAHWPTAGLPSDTDAGDPSAPRVLAMLDNGFPALSQKTLGRGKVLMWYVSLDMRHGNWPRDLTFLPAVNDMAWDLARQTPNEFAGPAGRALEYVLPPRLGGVTTVLLKTPLYPQQDLVTVPVQENGGRRSVTYPGMTHAGRYDLRLILAGRAEQTIYFSRQTDPLESELARADEAAIRAAVDRPARYLPNLALATDEAAEVSPLQSIGWLFMAALLLVLAVENFLAQRFGHYPPQAPAAEVQAS